jgi:hypothetical protein
MDIRLLVKDGHPAQPSMKFCDIKFCGNAIASLPIEPNLRIISIDEINNQLDSPVAPCK